MGLLYLPAAVYTELVFVVECLVEFYVSCGEGPRWTLFSLAMASL